MIAHNTIKPPSIKNAQRTVYLYAKADFNGISDRLVSFANSLTPEVQQDLSASQLWKDFKSTLTKAIIDLIPTKITSSKIHIPWLVEKKFSQLSKQILYNKARKLKTDVSWSEFRSLRRSLDRQIRKAQWSNVRDIIGASLQSDSPKPFWKYIKTRCQQSFGVPVLCNQGSLVTDAEDKTFCL